MSTIALPRFAVDLDNTFLQYERVFILGDLHDSDRQLRTFILTNSIGFMLCNDGDNWDDGLENMYVKPGILLLFLGDTLYKNETRFKSVMRFILRNKDNCLVVLGNNEVKFVYEHFRLFVDVARPFVQRRRFDLLLSLGRSKRNFCKTVDSIYSLIAWFRRTREDSEPKTSWRWFYDCLLRDYELDGRNCEDLTILMYILTETIVLGFSNRLKLILIHAGLNPERTIRNQLVTDVCNMRYVKRTKTPWFLYYEKLDYTIIYGHWSSLTAETAEPYFYNNTVCIDMGCCNTNVLIFVTFRTREACAFDQALS